MRYIIYGAGAIGSAIGAALHRAGVPVALISRGAHLDAIRSGGLTVQTSSGRHTVTVRAEERLSDCEPSETDIVILTMKSQDTEPAVRALAALGLANLAVVCAQNGVENERIALRRFRRVYGLVVMMPATMLEPGVVLVPDGRSRGILDVGRFPGEPDATAQAVAETLTRAGFSSYCVPDIMRWKYAKLLQNASTAVNILCKPHAQRDTLVRKIEEEAERCLSRAGIDWASREEMTARRSEAAVQAPAADPDAALSKPSLWQSLSRQSGSVEVDYFNGEFVLLGRLLGSECFVNQAFQELSNAMARERAAPGSLDPESVLRRAADLESRGQRIPSED